MQRRPVRWRQVSQWQNDTPEKISVVPFWGLRACLAAPQWQEMIMVVCVTSMVRLRLTTMESKDVGNWEMDLALYQPRPFKAPG